jgi:carbon storage regulator CsrA
VLVLSRKQQEVVVIGGSGAFSHLLKITVVKISPDKVKLGFDVATDIPVHRLEVYERINAAARPDRLGPAVPID